MSQIIRQREPVERVAYFRDYRWRDDPNAGFSFECDKDGKLAKKQPQASIKLCLELVKTGAMIDQGVIESRWIYTEPAIVRCDCGRHVALFDAMTNTCGCGRDYNGSGQKLAPRAQWGEETGETLADILRGGCYDGED